MKKKGRVKSANVNGFLYLGMAIVAAAAVLNKFFPQIPSAIYAVAYLIGVIALILYMWEIQYRRRTGDYNDEGTPVKGKNVNKRK